MIKLQERDIKTPRWSLLDTTTLNGLTQQSKVLFCKLTRYDNGNFINEHLIGDLDMPFINAYFLLG